MNYVRLMICLLAWCSILGTAHAGKGGGSEDPSTAPQDVNVVNVPEVSVTDAPTVADFRNFSASLNLASGDLSTVLDACPDALGQRSFVLTDMQLTGIGVSDALALRLYSGPQELGVFWVILDERGLGTRQVNFNTGMVRAPADGPAPYLRLDYVSGDGQIDAIISGYCVDL